VAAPNLKMERFPIHNEQNFIFLPQQNVGGPESGVKKG